MKKIFLSMAIVLVVIACGETPGTGTDSPESPSGPSDKNTPSGNGATTGQDSMNTGSADTSGILVMSSDSSQLKASSDSARKKSGANQSQAK